MGNKSNGRIHRYGASTFGDIIINASKSINEEKQTFLSTLILHVINKSQFTYFTRVRKSTTVALNKHWLFLLLLDSSVVECVTDG